MSKKNGMSAEAYRFVMPHWQGLRNRLHGVNGASIFVEDLYPLLDNLAYESITVREICEYMARTLKVFLDEGSLPDSFRPFLYDHLSIQWLRALLSSDKVFLRGVMYEWCFYLTKIRNNNYRSVSF